MTSWNFSDTSTTSVGQITPATINYQADFAKKVADATSLVLTNLTSPLDRPETVRYAVSKVGNVYTGSGLEPAYFSQVKSGVSVLVQDNTVLTQVDDSGTRVDYPITAHIVLKVPNSEVMTPAILSGVVYRLLGFLYEQSAATPDTRLARLVRGALTPAVLV